MNKKLKAMSLFGTAFHDKNPEGQNLNIETFVFVLAAFLIVSLLLNISIKS